uniref:Uncharacterized protein n=1 Tax=Anguilla anguilla TaxID=7936 RepID=A0A0E9V044_ANGAN
MDMHCVYTALFSTELQHLRKLRLFSISSEQKPDVRKLDIVPAETMFLPNTTNLSRKEKTPSHVRGGPFCLITLIIKDLSMILHCFVAW